MNHLWKIQDLKVSFYSWKEPQELTSTPWWSTFNKIPVVVQLLSYIQLFAIMWAAACQAPLSPLSPGVCSNSRPSSWWCHPIISSLVTPSVPALKSSLPVSQLLATGGQSNGASASASVLPVNTQGWFPLGLTGLILLFKESSRDFSNTTTLASTQKHLKASVLWHSAFFFFSIYFLLVGG